MASDEMKAKAEELVAAVKAGNLVVSPSGVVLEPGDVEGEVRRTAGKVVTHPTFQKVESDLSHYRDVADWTIAPFAEREVLMERLANEADQKLKESGLGSEAKEKDAEAKAKASNAKGGTASGAAKVEWPDVPEIKQPFGEDLPYVKTSTVQLADSDYTVAVKRNKEKAETFQAFLKGQPITVKSRAHKVVRAIFPYHTSKRRRGYDVEVGEAIITAKPNGQSTEKKVAGPTKKRDLVVPEGWSKMTGDKLKAGMQVYDLGGGARDGSVPEGEGVVEVVHHAHMQPDDYMFLRLGPVGSYPKGEPTRKKFLSGNKEIVARKAPGKSNGNGKTKKAKAAPRNTTAKPKEQKEVVTADVEA